MQKKRMKNKGILSYLRGTIIIGSAIVLLWTQPVIASELSEGVKEESMSEDSSEVLFSLEEVETEVAAVNEVTANELTMDEILENETADDTVQEQDPIADAEDEDASMELPDGTAYVEEIGVDMFGDTVLTYTNTATGTTGSTHSGNAIQNAFDAAIDYALGKTWDSSEKKEVTIVVENGEYVGDLNLINTMGSDSFMDVLLAQYGMTDNTFFKDFTFIIRSSDALDENGGLSANGAGGARVKGNLLIDNLNVILAGLTFGLDNSITVRNADIFEFYGTTVDDVVDIYIDSVEKTVYIDLGEGDDTLVATVDQQPAFNVGVTENVITQLTLPENILDMIKNMAEAELNNLLTYGISPSTSPTLNSLMEKLNETEKAAIEGELLTLIEAQLAALGENISDMAVELDVTVNGGEGHDRLQVSVNNNSNLDLMPANPMQGQYGIASLTLQMDMSRTNITMYGEEGNDQMMVDGNWKGMYQTMLLYKAMEELTEATLQKLNDEIAEVRLYGGEDDDTLQINTDYAFTTVWKSKAYMDGGTGVDRTNFAGAVNDGILAGIIPQNVTQIKKTENGNTTTYTLDAMKAWTLMENNITHIEQEIFWINKDFEIDNINIETFTDALANKFSEDVKWTANGYQGEKLTVESFKDYVIEITEDILNSAAEKITEFAFDVRDFFTNHENPGFLTQLIINLMTTDKITISNIYAPGWTVLITGHDMILGDIIAGDLFVSAVVPDLTIDGTIPTPTDTNIEMNVQDTNNTEVQKNLDGEVDVSLKSYLYRYEGKASIEMIGKTLVDRLAVITSSLTLDKGFITLPDIANLILGGLNPNIVVYKEGLSEVKILNDITAAAIQISAITNVDIDTAFLIELPLSGGISRTNNYLTIGSETPLSGDVVTLTATDGNVWLNAKTNVRINSYAKAMAAIPIAGAVSYMESENILKTIGNVEIIANGDVDMGANSIVNLDTVTTGATPYMIAVDVISGAFPALQVALIDNKVEVTENTNITSHTGDIHVNANSKLESSVLSLSVPGEGQESAFKMLAGLKFLEYFLGVPQGSFVKSRVPLYNITNTVINYFNTGTMGATDDNLYQPRDTQFVGAFSVDFIDHNNQALIDTNGTITALNGDVNVDAKADTVVDARADGSLYKTAAVANLISTYHQPNNAVGVGVGVNIITHNNKATYKKGTIKANGLRVTANSYTPNALIVKAGHVPTESSLGVGGAVAVNVYSSATDATVEEDAKAELGNGSLVVAAAQDGDTKLIGDASGRRTTLLDYLTIGAGPGEGTLPRVGSKGFGTGIVVNVTGIDVTARVKGVITQRTGTKLNNITVSSIFDGTEYVEARAGASAGYAIVPVVIVNISGVSALTEVETGTLLLTSGDANIHSEVNMIRTLIADADTVSTNVGFGGTFLINISEDTAETYLYSSVTVDGNVNVTAETISRLNGQSYASSKGSQGSLSYNQMDSEQNKYLSGQSKGQTDQFADKNLQNAATMANGVNSRNTNSSKVNKKMNNRQMASTAEGQVQVAAGFALNIQNSRSIAVIGRFKESETGSDDGEGDSETEEPSYIIEADLPEIIITAKDVTVETRNDTDGIIISSAAAVNSSVAVGVAVAINMVDYDNQVIVGNAGVNADTLTLQSVAIEIAQLKETEELVEELVRFITDVVGVEQFLQSIVYYEKNDGKLPTNEKELGSEYDMDEILNYFDNKEFNEDYENGGGDEVEVDDDADVEEVIERKYSELTNGEKELVKVQLNKALTNAILGGQTADAAGTAVDTIVESLATKIKEAMTLDNFLVMLLTGKNMFAEAFAEASTLFNGAVPRVQMALAQYLNSKFGGAEEMDGVGHKISTQTISGAGASNVGIAGSVAISLVNGKTVVTILDRGTLSESGKDIMVDGDLIVNAETVQKIYTTAASSAHEFGTSKDRLAAAVASANASGSSTKHKVSKTDKLTASGSGVGVGASVAFAKADNHVEASIGANRDVNAGNVSVTANLRNDVESISVAGQDPIARRDSIFDGEEQLTPPQITAGQAPTTQQIVYYGTDPQMASIDASVAIGMSENTVIARVGKNTNLAATGNLEVTAKEHGEGYAQSGGYAAGSRAAVGASAAANIAASNIIADFGGSGIIAGNAVIQAEAYNEDTAYALATTTGALLDRILQKVGDIQRWISLGSESGISSNSISNMLMNQLNRMLSPLTGMMAQPASTTFLKMLGIQIPASSKIPSGITNTAQNLGNALQAAAAVGVNLTQHNVTASVTGALQAANVEVTANNKANYRTVASGFNVVIYDIGGDYKISTGVAVSKNQNSANAIVDGTVISDKDINVYAQTTQNMDGTYAGLLTAQALSGGFGGTAIPAGFTLTGAFAGSFGEATTKAEVKDNAKAEAKGDVNVIAIDWSKQAVRAGSASLTANSVVTAGASVAVIDSENKIYALIGKNAEIIANDLTVQAFMLNVNEGDYVFPLDKSILITTGSNTDEEDKGIIHINMEPGKEGFGVNLETKDLLALVDAINYFATVNYYAEAISAEVAIGGSSMANMAGAVSVVLVKNIVEAIIDEGAVIVLTGDLLVDAQADAIARVIAGSASAGIARFGTGVSVAVFDESNQITASAGTKNAEIKGSIAAEKITINALNREEVLVVNIGMSVLGSNLGIGGSGTYAGNEGIVTAGIGSNMDVKAQSIDVNAVNESDIKVITTSPTLVVAGDAIAAAGGAMTIINTAKKTIAFIGDKTTVNSVNDIHVNAGTVEQLLNVSASLSATTGALSGAATVHTVGSYSTTKALVGDNTTLKSRDGNIRVIAVAESEIYNLLAAVSGSRMLAIGAVHMMTTLDRTVIAEVGISSILEALNGNVEVLADADSFILVPTVVGAIGGVAGGNGLIVTILGDDSVFATIGDYSISTAGGVVKVIADNHQELYEAALVLEVGTSVSAGGSIIDVIAQNRVEATTGDYVSLTGYNRLSNRDEKYRGINIQAFNYNRIVVANAGGAAAVGSVAVNGIVQNVIQKNQVIAGAGKHNTLNMVNIKRNSDGTVASGDHAEGSSDQGIIIEADDESELYIISGGLGASTSVGVGVGTQVIVYDNTVTAGIGDGSRSFAFGNIDVLANSTNTVWQVNASLTASGTVAVDVSANVIVFENEVTASLGGEAKAANIYVVADSKNEITQILVSFAASGTATVVPMAQVVYFESITKAYTFDGAVLNADGDVVVKALSREKLNSDSGQAAIAGTAGIGGTVIVAVTKQQTSAYTGANNTIDAANIYINAYDDYDYLVVNASLSGGSVAVGVNGSVHVAFSTVSASVGNNSKLTASGDVEVTAESVRTITMYGMSVTASPTVGVGVTIQVAVNGGKVNQDSADEINKYLSADQISEALGYGRGSEHALNDYLTAREEILADAMKGDGVKKTDTTLGSETSGGFDFDAQTGYYDKDKLENIENSEANLDKDGAADLTFDPDSNEDIEEAAGLYDELPESYKELETKNQKDTVYASIGAGTVVNAGNNILVRANDLLTVELVTGNVTGSGTVAVGAGMAVIVTNTEVTATVGNGAVLIAGGDIEILADGNYVLNTTAINGSVAGTVSVSGTVAAIDIYSNIEATLKGDVKGAKNLYVKATMENQKLNAQTLSASASSTASVPVSIAMVLMNGKLEAGISGADISGVNNIYVSTSNHFAPTVESLTAGAAMVAVRGAIALAINRQKQYTYIDETSSVAGAKIVSVTAEYDSVLEPTLIGAGAGKVAIGLQGVAAIDTPEILTYIGVRPTVELVGTATGTVAADKIIVGHTVKSDISTKGAFAGGGLVEADMTVMLAINRLTAISSIRGINIDGGSVDVYANIDASATSVVLSAQVGGMTIGATAFVSQLFADNRALIETTGSDIAADSITVTAGTKEDINEMTSEATGLAAGAGAVNVRVNAAVADNNAVNAVRIFGTGKVTVTGSVTADTYGKALATAKVLAANLSATGSVGAQFALALLRVQQTAEAGDGGTLTADNITVHAELNQNISESQATATVSNISGSMAGANANIAVAMNRSSNKAGAGADTLKVNGAIDVQSKGKSRAEAKAQTISLRFVTAGAQVTYAYAEGIFDSWLYVGQTGNAGSVNVNTTYNTHAKANSIPTGFGLLNIKGNAAVAKVDGTATAKVRGNGALTVTGAVNVVTSGSAAAVAEVPSVQMENISGMNIGINVAVALVEQAQTAEVSIKNLSADSLTVHALLNGEGETTKANVGSADSYVQAQILNGEVNVAYARNSTVAEALISGTNVASKGAIVVRSEGTVNATADRYSPEAQVSLINVNVIHTHAVTNGLFEANAIFGSGTSSGDSLTVETLFNSLTYAAAEAAGSVVNYEGIGVNSAYAKTAHQFNAGVETKGNLNVSKDILVQTKGHTRAEAIIRTGYFSINAVNVAGNAATTYADAIQHVWFRVTGSSEIGGSLNVKAVLESKDGKESGAHSIIAPQKNSGVSLSLINGEANVLTTESRMYTKVEVNGGTKTTVGGNLTVTTDLTTVARTTGNDAGVNVAFATVAVQILDPYVQNTLDVIFGGNIQINGDFEVNVTTDSIAQAYVKNPTIVGAIAYPTMKISAQIGTTENPNRITITFNDGTNIHTKGDLEVRPVNKTYAGIKLENTNSLSSISGIVVDADILSTETYVLTEIYVGENAYLKSEKELILDAKNSAQAQPRLDMTKNIGIWLSGGVFKHNHTIYSDITITIADGAALDAWEGMTVHGNADVYHNLTHHVENSGFIGSGDLEAELTVTRNVIINIGEDVTMLLLSGDMNILSETGANDDIFIDVFGKSKGFIAFGEAHVKVTVTDNARVNVDQGAHLRVNAGDINLIAKAGMKHLEIYSQWDSNGLGADAEVYTTMKLNPTAIVRIGEQGAKKDAILRANFITGHAGLGDVDIYTYTEASGDDQIGKVKALTNLEHKMDIQVQIYNAQVTAVEYPMYYATGFLKDFNKNSVRIKTKTDIGLGSSNAASAMKEYGQMRIVIDESYSRDAGNLTGWGGWFVGYDDTLDENGDTYYVVKVESDQNGTFVDYYKLNKNNVFDINNNMYLDINMDIYEATGPLTPDLIIDIYEKEDGSIGVNAFGYDVPTGGNEIKNIPNVWVENGMLHMDAFNLTLGGSVEITVINRTDYALVTPGVILNGDYGEEYNEPLAGHNQFRYLTTNDKDVYITHGLGNHKWTFNVVEFHWLGENAGNAYLTTDVVPEEIKDLDIVINEDGSYTTSDDEFIIHGVVGDGEKLFIISGSDIVMDYATLSAQPIYEGGIYISDSAQIPNIIGVEHIHFAGDRIPRSVNITNNSTYNLVMNYIYEILGIDIISSKGTDVTIGNIYGSGESSITWKDGVSGNIFAAKDSYFRTGTLRIKGAKQVGTDENPMRLAIVGDDSYIDIESSDLIHIIGRNVSDYTYDPETKTATYIPRNYLKFKHLNSNAVKIHVDETLKNLELIPICEEDGCADITAEYYYIENSTYGPWKLGSDKRPILLDVGRVIFTKEDGITGDEITAIDYRDIYLTAVDDLNVDFNKIYMLDDDGDKIYLQAPNGVITITNNHISSSLNLIAKEEITFLDGNYTWYEDSILETGSGLVTIGGDFVVDGNGKDFSFDGVLKVDENLIFQSSEKVTAEEITIGKLVESFVDAPVTIVTEDDIIIGSGIGYTADTITLNSTTGDVMILGREWLAGVPVIAGNEVYIHAAGGIYIGEGNGTISTGSNINLNAGEVFINLTKIAQDISIRANTPDLIINAGSVSGAVTNNNAGNISVTANASYGLTLETEGAVNLNIANTHDRLDITADMLNASDLNVTDGTWDIENEVTLNSLSVAGTANLQAKGWKIGTLRTVGNQAQLTLNAATGDIVVDTYTPALYSEVVIDAAGNIVFNNSFTLNSNLTATAGKNLVVNGNVTGAANLGTNIKAELIAGETLTVNGTIEKKDAEEFILEAKNIEVNEIISIIGNGKIDITADENITVAGDIKLQNGATNETTNTYTITAGGELKVNEMVVRDGYDVVVNAEKINLTKAIVDSKAAITGKDLFKINAVTVGAGGELTLTVANTTFETSGNTYIGEDSTLNISVNGAIGTKENPWKVQFYKDANVNIDVAGEVWVNSKGYTIEPHFTLSDRTNHLGIVAGSGMASENVYVEKANGNLTLETVGTTPRLHVDVLDGNVVLTVPDMNIEYVNANGDVIIYTEKGMNNVVRYVHHEDTIIRAAGDIRIISGADIGTKRNRNYSLQGVTFEYTGTEKGKVYLEAKTSIYAALKGYEDVEISGDAITIHSLTADGALNVRTNADLMVEELTAGETPNIYLGAVNTIVIDRDTAFNIFLNDDADRITSAEELAQLLGATIDENGTIVLNSNVIFGDAVIIDFAGEVILDLNGYSITQGADNVAFAVEKGTLKLIGSSVTGTDAYPVIWIGTNGILALENVKVTGNTPIHAVGGMIYLLESTQLSNTGASQDAITYAGTDRNSARPFATVLYEEEPEYSGSTIDIIVPGDGTITYDGNGKEVQVWVTDKNGQTMLADDNWYTVTYEQRIAADIFVAIEGIPVNAGNYRAVITVTEEGKALGLTVGTWDDVLRKEFEIAKGTYSANEVTVKDTIKVPVDKDDTVQVGALFGWDYSNLFTYPEDAHPEVEEWNNTVAFDEESGTYTLHYTIESNNQILTGEITLIVMNKLTEGEDFMLVAPSEDVLFPVQYNEYGYFTNEAGKDTKYGIAVQGTGTAELKVQYSIDGVNWQDTPILFSKVSEAGEKYTVYYRIESEEGFYEGSYSFSIDKLKIENYKDDLINVTAQDKDGNPLAWDSWSDSDYMRIDVHKGGVYITLEKTELAKERGWQIEYYLDDGSGNQNWILYDGSRILLTEELTKLRYRISGDDNFEEPYVSYNEENDRIWISLYRGYENVDVYITEDGRIYIKGMEAGVEFDYSVGIEHYDEELGDYVIDGTTVKGQIVSEDGIVWLDTKLFTNDYNNIRINTYQTLEDGTIIPYLTYTVPWSTIIPGQIEDIVSGSSGTTTSDGKVTTNDAAVKVQLPDTLPEDVKAYIFAKYDEKTGTWKVLGPEDVNGNPDADAIFDAIMNGSWNADVAASYLETLQDVYDANGNGLVKELLRILYLSDYMFDINEDDTEEFRKEYFAKFIASFADSEQVDNLEGAYSTNLEYSVFLHEEDTPDLKDLIIRIEYPDGSYTVQDDIFDEPIRVYHYDGTAKWVKVIAVDADGKEIELSEDLYTIVYEKISAAQIVALRLRQGSVIPLEAGYLYRATIYLTSEAIERFGLSDANIDLEMVEFVIGNADAHEVEEDLNDGTITAKDVNVTVKEDEVIYPSVSGAFKGLRDNQIAVVEDWALGVSFKESGTYAYKYKIYTYYDDMSSIITEGWINLIVDVTQKEEISYDVTVDGFGEDTEADPDKTHELIVKPVDDKAELTVEYSEDGRNWQAETFKYSKPGTYKVYYRVLDADGNVVKSGMDEIILTAKKLKAEAEVVSPKVEVSNSTGSYEGTLGDDNHFEVNLKVSEGDEADYKVEYSVLVNGYWTDYSETLPELAEGENLVRIRVTSLKDSEYYEEYTEIYRIVMNKERQIPVKEIDNSVTVKGFEEDESPDYDKVYQLIVTRNNKNAQTIIEYSIDGINWQTEVIDITGIGTFTVYYRVTEMDGEIIQSGSDTITLYKTSEPINPEEPVDPEEPTDSDKPEVSDKIIVSDNRTEAVKTGDDTNGFGWLAMMLLAMLFIGWGIRRGKNNFIYYL